MKYPFLTQAIAATLLAIATASYFIVGPLSWIGPIVTGASFVECLRSCWKERRP